MTFLLVCNGRFPFRVKIPLERSIVVIRYDQVTDELQDDDEQPGVHGEHADFLSQFVHFPALELSHPRPISFDFPRLELQIVTSWSFLVYIVPIARYDCRCPSSAP